ncbi:hypothetical protein ACFRNJ_12335 [Streptomyces sp. NPDC056721]|uniref:hypothetical protein n=1 Tax=Streptomyces sp. NPDC056721 TaxID=3345923 RepID=UPI0036B3CB7B
MRSANIPSLSVSPVVAVVEGARRFNARHGLATRDHWDYSRVVVAPAAVAKIADAYDALPFISNDAPAAWRAMAEETMRQFEFMTAPTARGGLGITVSVEDTDPYDISQQGTRAFFEDVANGRMRVLSTAVTGSHFFFSDDVNNAFRAVHDVFGHAGTGRGVDRHGEEAAYRKHSGMFSPLARKALATETRGQNHAMIAAGGEFQAQKVAVLPRWAREFEAVRPASLAEYRKTLKQAAAFHAAQGLDA